jgi:hypothetical protein
VTIKKKKVGAKRKKGLSGNREEAEESGLKVNVATAPGRGIGLVGGFENA